MKTLLLIHGWGFGAGIWQPLRQHLAAGIDVRMPSLPGYDGSQSTADEDIVATLAAVIDQPAVIVGWSLGGLLALELARRYPEKVSALGLVASLPCFNRAPDWAAGWDTRALAAVQTRLQQNAAAAHRYVATLAAHGDANSGAVKQTLVNTTIPPVAVLKRDLDYLAVADWRAEFAALRPPVRVWLGARDALIGGDCVAALRSLQPAAEIRVLPDRGHALPLSAAGAIVEEMELWL